MTTDTDKIMSLADARVNDYAYGTQADPLHQIYAPARAALLAAVTEQSEVLRVAQSEIERLKVEHRAVIDALRPRPDLDFVPRMKL